MEFVVLILKHQVTLVVAARKYVKFMVETVSQNKGSCRNLPLRTWRNYQSFKIGVRESYPFSLPKNTCLLLVIGENKKSFIRTRSSREPLLIGPQNAGVLLPCTSSNTTTTTII